MQEVTVEEIAMVAIAATTADVFLEKIYPFAADIEKSAKSLIEAFNLANEARETAGGFGPVPEDQGVLATGSELLEIMDNLHVAMADYATQAAAMTSLFRGES